MYNELEYYDYCLFEGGVRHRMVVWQMMRFTGGTSTTEFVTSPGFVPDILPRNEHCRMKLSFSLNGNGTCEQRKHATTLTFSRFPMGPGGRAQLLLPRQTATCLCCRHDDDDDDGATMTTKPYPVFGVLVFSWDADCRRLRQRVPRLGRRRREKERVSGRLFLVDRLPPSRYCSYFHIDFIALFEPNTIGTDRT